MNTFTFLKQNLKKKKLLCLKMAAKTSFVTPGGHVLNFHFGVGVRPEGPQMGA